MSLITNRKRPRGFSDTFEESRRNANSSAQAPPAPPFAAHGSLSLSSAYNDSPTNLNMNITLDGSSDTTLHNSALQYAKKPDQVYIIDDEDDEEGMYDQENDDVVILEERTVQKPPPRRATRNNLDLVLVLDHDAFAAYNMFNVNNAQHGTNAYFGRPFEIPSTIKKQRTNSLPQLPQAKCFYNKLPSNYVLQHPKMGNVRTNVIPHKTNLPPCDDKEGHYVIRINDTFANRFTITKLLGQGTFGKVVECYDRINRETVAIKIIRNIPKYRDAAKIELRILSTLKKFDNDNNNHCIHLRECFDFRGHICIVTDLLKILLYDFMENNHFIPYPGSHIQAILKQLIRLVTFLHDLNLIHTDLKPENILLHDDSFRKKRLFSQTTLTSYTSSGAFLAEANQYRQSVKKPADKTPKLSRVLNNPLIQIIDFGSAIFDDEYHSSIVSTRHYRAPEIVLGVGWSFPCDMWLVACILVELVLGEPLFRTHDNLEHLAMTEKVCGYKIDKPMVRLSKQKDNECGLKHFTNDFNRSDDEDDYDEENDGDDVIIDDELTEDNSLSLIFPLPNTDPKFIESVRQLDRIDRFVGSRIGFDLDFDYSLSENYEKNKHLINFGNFTFWWFFVDLLRKLFVINPYDRLSAQDALEHPWFNLGIEDEGTV